jgi:hypothetical protein
MLVRHPWPDVKEIGVITEVKYPYFQVCWGFLKVPCQIWYVETAFPDFKVMGKMEP